MKAVLTHVARRKLVFSRSLLLARLRDESIAPDVRLRFMPGVAFFIMAFGDLNRYLLRQEPAADAFQERINAHTHEDDHHWLWYLEDLEKLGWSDPTTTTDALRKLWSEDTHRSRLLTYELCAVVAATKGVERLAVVEAIEETGNVVFSATAAIAEAIRVATGKELRYMGKFHLDRESGHAQHSEHAELAAIVLEEDQRNQCIALVDRVFDAFTAWTHEAARLIDRHVESGIEKPRAA